MVLAPRNRKKVEHAGSRGDKSPASAVSGFCVVANPDCCGLWRVSCRGSPRLKTKHLDAALDEEGSHLRDGESERLMREREPGNVEIAGRDKTSFARIDQRAVRGGVELDFDVLHGARERVMCCAMHLGHAAKRQRVLDTARGTGHCESTDRVPKQPCRRLGLARRGPRVLRVRDERQRQVGTKSLRRTAQSLRRVASVRARSVRTGKHDPTVTAFELMSAGRRPAPAGPARGQPPRELARQRRACRRRTLRLRRSTRGRCATFAEGPRRRWIPSRARREKISDSGRRRAREYGSETPALAPCLPRAEHRGPDTVFR